QPLWALPGALREAQAGSSLRAFPDLELIGEGLDDRDSEAPFRQLVVHGRGAPPGRRLEALTLVGDLDDELVGVQLVDDLDRAVGIAVRVPDRVRTGFRQRELEIAEHLLTQRLRTHARDAGQGEPAQRD